MTEPLQIQVKIVRRRFTGLLRTAIGIKSLVYVTYSSQRLAPEVVTFFTDNYSPEIEQEEITKRVKRRLGIADTEVSIEFIEA